MKTFTTSDLLMTTSLVRVEAPSSLFSVSASACTNAVDQPMPSIEDMLATMRELAAQPVYIGELLGMDVYADPALQPGEVVLKDPATGKETLRFSIEHPYVQGTKIEKAAREVLRG